LKKPQHNIQVEHNCSFKFLNKYTNQKPKLVTNSFHLIWSVNNEGQQDANSFRQSKTKRAVLS